MPYCAKCGAELKEDDKFCSACGTPVTPVAEPERRAEREGKKPVSTLTIVLIVLVVVVVVVAVGVMALFWMLGGLWQGPWPAGQVVGSGKLVTEEMIYSDFTAVDVEMGFEVVITQLSSYSVSITADDDLFDYIQVSKIGETLEIGLKSGYNYRPSTLRAEVTMPDLYELSLSSGSHGTVEGFSLDKFVLDLSGGSHVKAEGTAKDLSISASSGSHLDLSNFPVHDVDVNLSGGSHATINLDGRLDADISGGSHLSYLGEPTLGDIETSGGSTVNKK